MSLVVVVYNIPREAARTMRSLCTAYQRDISADAYEVIVVDNGSDPPFDRSVIDRLPGQFRLIRLDGASPSPARAINRGLAAARGEVIGVMVDGARIVTPGLLHFARHGAGLYERSVVATLGWHLGFDVSQKLARDAGYGGEREEALLASIGWPDDGYRLFEIAALDGSSINGWLASMSESNALFLPRGTWQSLGGVDERFDAPGGGLLNLDTFRRAVEMPGARLVMLLGEATFHQAHGGIATGTDADTFRIRLAQWLAQYEAIRRQPWGTPEPREPRTFLGGLPRAALAHFVRLTLHPVPHGPGGSEPPLGPAFDSGLWSVDPPVPSGDPLLARLVDLAQTQFRLGHPAAAAAVARVARTYAPDEPAPQRLLAHASAWCVRGEPPADQRATTHVALGHAYTLLGDRDRGANEYRSALALDRNLPAAHMGLASLRMPGDDYRIWLDRFHETLRPETYVEIGVYKGATLGLARPPTLAFGIDPEPCVDSRFRTETHLFTETSDAVFAGHRLETALGGRRVRLAFIDGLHSMEQCLRDFMNLERHCGPASVILLHDTVPLDEPTQRRPSETAFWTGDVWKALLALKHYRPDLDIFTIASAPTGLTVVTGLDPSSGILFEVYDDAVKKFSEVPFGDVEHRLDEAFSIVPNDWDLVRARLTARGIL